MKKFAKYILFFLSIFFYTNDLAAQRNNWSEVGHTASINYASFNSDGKWILTASEDKTAKIWDAANGNLLYTLSGHTAEITFAEYSSDDEKILTCGLDGQAKVWSNKGTLLFSIKAGSKFFVGRISPEANVIYTSSADMGLQSWDASTGLLIKKFASSKYSGSFINFSNDGKKMLTSSMDTVKVWDRKTGNLLMKLKGHTMEVYSAYFSPDDKFISSSSRDGFVKIWTASYGKNTAEFNTYGGWNLSFVYDAKFQQDGKRILTASSDNTAKIFDMYSSRMVKLFAGHKGEVTIATFNPENTQVLTASDDGTARIWDIETSQPLFVLKGHDKALTSAQYNEDGTKILTASADKTVRVWDAATGKLLVNIKGSKKRK